MEILFEENRDEKGYLINNNYDKRGVEGMAYDDVMDCLPPRYPEDEKYMQCYQFNRALLPDEELFY